MVASVERIMRYYGATVDQHELAQIANTDASLGTSYGGDAEFSSETHGTPWNKGAFALPMERPRFSQACR